MKQFQVPQFITIEDKVIGPFTIKQFLYLLVPGGVAFLAYKQFQAYIYVPIGGFFASLGIALAFLKINEQPFPKVLKNAFLYMLRPHLYIWKKDTTKKAPRAEKQKKEAYTLPTLLPKISESKLSDLAWSLNIKNAESRSR